MKYHEAEVRRLPSIHDDTFMERARIPYAFRELTQTVEAICLSKPLEAIHVSERPAEAELVARLGSHGLRMALEIMSGAEMAQEYSPDGLATGDVVRMPEIFTHESYPESAAWAHAFGDALLNEAYTVLGADVDRQLAAYRAAATVEEQRKVIDWLNDRMAAMKETDEVAEVLAEGDTENYLLYHPIRLAPKAIGIYPDIQLPPTCLSFSIIAASFLREAGAVTMHAGVMSTDYEENINNVAYQSILSSKQITRQVGTPTDLSESLDNRAQQYRDDLLVDHGYHAAVLVKLMDGTWCQIDPNFHATTPLVGFMNERIQGVYDTLQSFVDVSPALEIGVPLIANTPLISYVDAWRDVETEGLLPYRDRVAAILTSEDDECVMQRLHECIVDIYLNLYPITTPTEEGDQEEVRSDVYFRDEYLFSDSVTHEKAAYYSQQTIMADAVAHLVTKYVWYDAPNEAVRERCRDDAAYLDRRVDDVLSVIPALRTTSADSFIDLMSDYQIPHTKFEVGNTETRIGFAVLNDFASYFPNELPATFWHSNWPSLIPVTERSTDHESVGQWRGIHNMLGLTHVRYLRYDRKYDKIQDAMPPIPERR